ncbi:hypothetical protein [Halobacterium jilantaiense]|uniref:Uncharacterized protein n=1 Tax=Halobacterium jilantaiense TaxID=355548 RepID=A0A1I0N3Z8_9EURY|nr:hypothetical protein [Halobacterium jilantaiense]SEV95758.1 hypothetical protein SAMN04487945_0588 [Halobacterium jilantaiense]
MGNESPTEACGRCSMTTVVDAAVDEDEGRDPFGDDRIEVEESELTRVNPVAWTRRVTARLNDAVEQFAYGR